MSHLNFEFWHFPPIFVLLKLTCLVTLFDRKIQVFKNSPKWTIFGIFKCKRSSLRSQCWMRLFLWFSNTVSFRQALLLSWLFCRTFQQWKKILKIRLLPRFTRHSFPAFSFWTMKALFKVLKWWFGEALASSLLFFWKRDCDQEVTNCKARV